MLTDRVASEYDELRGIWRRDPLLYARQRLGLNPTHQQASLIEAIAEPGAKVSVRAGHGVGKTGSVSASIWWFLECFDFVKVPCTAPSASQLRDVLWAELSKWQRRSDEEASKNGLEEALYLSNLFKIVQDRVVDIGAPDEWFAVARTARKENPDALQGFHASNITISADGRSIQQDQGDDGQIMFVVEEAPGVPDAIFEVAEGALSSAGARLLMVGNPTRSKGFFARSHHQDRAMYRALHFSCADSPLVEPNYRANLVRKYGEGSNVVRVRADGEFPKQDDDVLIALEWAEAARYRERQPASGKRILGVDVARFGDDRTTFVLRQGPNVEFVKISAKQDLMVTAGEALMLAKSLKADAIHVDVIGVGAGVVDRLNEKIREEKLSIDVVSVCVSESAPEQSARVIGSSGKSHKVEAQGAKLRDFIWMEMKEWFSDQSPSFQGVDRDHAEDLAGEVSTVTYKIDSSGRIVVESKDDMKRRGLRSPDIADALGATFMTGRRVLVTGQTVSNLRSLMATRGRSR